MHNCKLCEDDVVVGSNPTREICSLVGRAHLKRLSKMDNDGSNPSLNHVFHLCFRGRKLARCNIGLVRIMKMRLTQYSTTVVTACGDRIPYGSKEEMYRLAIWMIAAVLPDYCWLGAGGA